MDRGESEKRVKRRKAKIMRKAWRREIKLLDIGSGTEKGVQQKIKGNKEKKAERRGE